MQLITDLERERLISNGLAQRDAKSRRDAVLDFEPVVKLIVPGVDIAFLITEIVPGTDLAFGLCDFGLGAPELGYVSLNWLTAILGPLELPVQRDPHFAPTQALSAYANRAFIERRIVT